jgi:diguanylate cyclase (GGDEF)-like protein
LRIKKSIGERDMYAIDKKKTIVKISSIILIATMLFGLLEIILISDYKREIKNYDDDCIARYEEEYNTIVSGYRMIAKTYDDEIINKDEILKIMSTVYSANAEKKSYLREKLADELQGTYENMVANNFRQFHFVLNDDTSFLRMHKKDKFGDSLTDIRDTVRIVNSYHRYAEGFEEGRVFNGYRFEYPLFYKETYLGCVETSISFMSIIQLMDELFENPTSFMIKKSIVNGKVWQEQIADNYRESKLSADYYYDREALSYVKKYGNYSKLIENVVGCEDFISKLDSFFDDGETFLVNSDINGTMYSITFLSIKNVVGKSVGYLVFYSKNEAYGNFKRSMIIKSFLVFFLWILVMAIIVLSHASKEKVNRVMYTDKLTGAYNRNRFYEYMKMLMEKAHKSGGDLAIIIYDVDYFKLINDKYGHLVGDAVLKETTDLIKKNIRSTDRLFRFGGDEFIIALTDTDLAEAGRLAENIRKMVYDRTHFAKTVHAVTLSMGVAEYKDGEQIHEFIARADYKLYEAKEAGRNIVKG